MTAIEKLKASATAFAAILNAQLGTKLRHTHALHAYAAMHGCANWNVLHATGIPLHPPSAEKLAHHLAVKHGMSLSTDAANRILAQLEKPTAPASTGAKAICFVHDALAAATGENHEWRIHNPNELAGETLDGLLEENSGLRASRVVAEKFLKIASAYPGDLEALHSAAVAAQQCGDSAAARGLWRQAWDLLKSDFDRMLRDDPHATVEYGLLDNRPFYRVLHGIVTCLMASNDLVEKKEGLRVVAAATKLSRNRDPLGFRDTYTSALLMNGKFVQAVRTTQKREGFDMVALRALGLSLMKSPKAPKAMDALIAANPFAAEFIARGKRSSRAFETVALGTWEEGAAHLNYHYEAWAKEQSWRALQRKKARILSAQHAAVQRLFGFHYGENTFKDYLGRLGTVLTRLPYWDDGRAPMLRSILPEDSKVYSLTEKQGEWVDKKFEEGMFPQLHTGSQTVASLLDWLLCRCIRLQSTRFFGKIGESEIAIALESRADGRVALPISFKTEFIRAFAALAGDTRYPDEMVAAFKVKLDGRCFAVKTALHADDSFDVGVTAIA